MPKKNKKEPVRPMTPGMMEMANAKLMGYVNQQNFGSLDEANEFFEKHVTGKRIDEIVPPHKGRKKNTERSDELMYEAYESAPAKGKKLAREALKLNPENVRALTFLAEQETSPEKALKLYKEAMDTGARQLGETFFAENKGHFWLMHETRPYMTARLRYADCLSGLNRFEEATRELYAILELNPSDNQGARYQLASVLLKSKNYQEFFELDKHRGDKSSFWLYNITLALFATEGGSQLAEKALKNARRSNNHIFNYLTEPEEMKLPTDEYFSPGDENEAFFYILDNLFAWVDCPEALTWLTSYSESGPLKRKPHSPMTVVKNHGKEKIKPATQVGAPVFTHPEIEILYEEGIDIPLASLDAIKSLPRKTLIKDLETVILDSIARFEIFRAVNPDEVHCWFPLHALFLLRDLGAEESLPTVLDFLEQDNDFHFFYAGDILTEELMSVVAVCGRNQLDLLASFIKEPGHHPVIRIIITEAVEQMALHDLITKKAVSEWIKDLAEFFMEHKEDEDLADTGLVAELVCIVSDLRLQDLSMLVKKLYDNGMVDIDYAGDWKEISDELKLPMGEPKKREIASIEKTYENIREWTSYEYTGPQDNLFTESPDRNDNANFFNSDTPFVRKSPKIGRNDPCYCGSGKKYKKCHGDNIDD